MSQWYSYAAIDRTGCVIRGHKLADNRAEVKLWLAQEQVLLLKLKAGKASNHWLRRYLPRMGSSADLTTLEALSADLSVLLAANVLLPEALAILETTGEKKVALIAHKLHERLGSGQNLSTACEQEPDVFGTVYPKLFVIGESTGDLALIFRELLQSVRWNRDLQRRISQLLSYPLLMLVVMLGVLIFLLVSVVPQLLTFVTSVQQDFPWYTTLLFYLSSALIEHGWSMLTWVLLSPLVLLFYAFLQRRHGQIDTMMIRLWLIGPLLRQVKLARYFHALAILSRAGVDYLTAISLASQTLGNHSMQKMANSVVQQVNQGRALSSAMHHSGLFPPLVWRMVGVGELSGELTTMFQHIAEQYDIELARRISIIEQILPPALIVVIGLVLMWIIVSVLGPLYDTIINSGAALL